MRGALNRIAKWIVRRCLDLIAKVHGMLGLSDKKMKLLVQPTDGITPLIQGIEKAKKSIQVVIFRFDRTDIERALEKAVARGVTVHALIAFVNRGGEKKLRKLEMRLLEAGVTVARTSDDLLRYHDKLMIIDGKVLYVLAFNFTSQDIEHSRSFGVVTKDRRYVQEAIKLFAADVQRRPYVPGVDTFLVSPLNARKQLDAFIKGAKQQLLIYDPNVSDHAMIGLLEARVRKGVEVKIMGHASRKPEGVAVSKPPIRLHTRTIIRDRRQVFIGSQSLSAVELNARREVGIISRDSKLVDGVIKAFESDWLKAESSPGVPLDAPAIKATKKVAKAIAKQLPPVAPILQQAVKKAIGGDAEIKLDTDLVEEAMRGAIKDAVRGVVKDVVQDAVQERRLQQRK
jgi:cardiolipin synthase